jgi:integrase
MPRTTKPLTNTEVSQAKAKSKEYNLADGGGLALRVKSSGVKTWVFNYSKPFTKKRTNISFGIYPEVSLADARKKRRDARELLAENIDPKEHKLSIEADAKEALENTLQALSDKWHTLKATRVKETTLEKFWLSFKKHILPELGKMPVSELKPKHVLKTLEPVINQEKRETAKRLARTLNEIMTLAVASGHIEVNYLADVTKLLPTPESKKMPTIKPEELTDLMKAIAGAEISKPTRCLIEWQLHTMTRPSEAVKARWEDIDIEKKVWTIPAEQMKMKRSHTIPLSSYLMDLLNEIKSFSEKREYLFPGYHNPRTHMNAQTANMAIRRMGYGGKLVAHGLRALASTTLNEHGFNPDVIETALAHQDGNAIRAAYNRAEYLEQRRAMMDWWSEHIQSAVSNTSFQDDSNIIKFR